MGKRYFIAVLLLVLTMTSAAADNTEMAEVLDEMTLVMSDYAAAIESAAVMEDYIEANTALAEALERLGSRLGRIYLEHGSWFQDPPPGLERTMERHMEVQKRYEEALQKAMQYANDHMDVREYQDSFKRLNQAIYSMYE